MLFVALLFYFFVEHTKIGASIFSGLGTLAIIFWGFLIVAGVGGILFPILKGFYDFFNK